MSLSCPYTKKIDFLTNEIFFNVPGTKLVRSNDKVINSKDANK